MNERDLIARLLRPLATHAAARGLADDAAVLSPGLGRDLVLTHDVLIAGVHYLPGDPPSDIAWKLLAVNLSDLAAMGARPVGVLLGLALSGEDETWLAAFTTGLRRVLDKWNVALLGGDTTAGAASTVLGLTAIGEVAGGKAVSRSGARPGDGLYVSGTIGDAGLGLAVAKGDAPPDTYLLNRYRRPEPRLALGRSLVGVASAMMDVSDGLLIDAARMGDASGVALDIDLTAMPVSDAARARVPDGDAGLLSLATAGDDYELLFTAPGPVAGATRIGSVVAGAGLRLTGGAGPLPLPDRLGWEHGG